MILLAESGASKTAWRIGTQQTISYRWQGRGLNPSTLEKEAWLQELGQQLRLGADPAKIQELHFYGAGLGQAQRLKELQRYFAELLPNARLFLFDDLMAAVHAQMIPEGVVLIMGTGSNAAYFRNGEVIARAGGLGYLLGDEGSGVDLGKELLRGALMHGWRTGLQNRILDKLAGDRSSLIQKLYQSDHPAAHLAALARVVYEFVEEPEVEEMVILRFGRLLDSTATPLMKGKEMPVVAVGSIAHYFRTLLHKACEIRGLQLGDVQQSPINSLERRIWV